MILPKKKRYIEVPEGGWEEQAFYAVHVAVSPQNPIWGAILYTGFLNGRDGGPGGYSTIWSPTSDPVRFEDVHYLRVLHKLDVPHGHIREEDLP